MSYYKKWSQIMNINKITCGQDPLIEIDLPKEQFNEIYKVILDELEGQNDDYESYVDYYFTINPIRSFVLSFKGEKEKTEFYNIGLKKESVLSLKEIHEGENKKE